MLVACSSSPDSQLPNEHDSLTPLCTIVPDSTTRKSIAQSFFNGNNSNKQAAIHIAIDTIQVLNPTIFRSKIERGDAELDLRAQLIEPQLKARKTYISSENLKIRPVSTDELYAEDGKSKLYRLPRALFNPYSILTTAKSIAFVFELRESDAIHENKREALKKLLDQFGSNIENVNIDKEVVNEAMRVQWENYFSIFKIFVDLFIFAADGFDGEDVVEKPMDIHLHRQLGYLPGDHKITYFCYSNGGTKDFLTYKFFVRGTYLDLEFKVKIIAGPS